MAGREIRALRKLAREWEGELRADAVERLRHAARRLAKMAARERLEALA